MIYCLKKNNLLFTLEFVRHARPSTKIIVQPFGYTSLKHAHQDDIHKPKIAGQKFGDFWL